MYCKCSRCGVLIFLAKVVPNTTSPSAVLEKSQETEGQEVEEASRQDVQDANGMLSQWVETVMAKSSEKSDTM